MNEKEFKKAFEKDLPKKTSDKIADLTNAITKALADAKLKLADIDGDGSDALKTKLGTERDGLEKELLAATGAPVTPKEKAKNLQELYKNGVRHLKAVTEAPALLLDRQAVSAKAVELKKVLADNGDDPTELDKLVAKARKNPKDPDNHVLIRAAMVARYDLETFDAPMSKKATAKLYDILALVPLDHVKNPKLKNIARLKVDDSSYYAKNSNEIVLTIKKSSGDILPHRRHADGDLLPTTFDYFKETALHEVGHAVDADKKFMENRRGDLTYGGWQEPKIEQVADKIIDHAGLKTDFPHIARGHLRAIVENALTNGKVDASAIPVKRFPDAGSLATMIAPLLKEGDDYDDHKYQELKDKVDEYQRVKDSLGKDATPKEQRERDEALGKILKETDVIVGDPVANHFLMKIATGDLDKRLEQLTEWIELDQGRPADTDAADLEKHKAFKIALAIRLKSESSGLWDKGASGAKKWAMGEEVYQESYKGQWVSYLLKARSASSISTYQFRAAGEWFAELYGAAYGGTLPKSHSAWDWMKKDDIADYEKITARKSKKK